MSFRVEDLNDLRKHMHIDHNMIFYEEQISSCVECHSEFFVLAEMSFTVEDHYDLRKHINIDHNMIFYEEQKSSCDECHSKLKTTTT